MLHDESVDPRPPQFKVFASSTADDIEAIISAARFVADLEARTNSCKVFFECSTHKTQANYADGSRC